MGRAHPAGIKTATPDALASVLNLICHGERMLVVLNAAKYPWLFECAKLAFFAALRMTLCIVSFAVGLIPRSLLRLGWM
jgi:hypothetical protein